MKKIYLNLKRFDVPKIFDTSKGHMTKDFLVPYLAFVKENKDFYLVFNKYSALMENEKLFNLLVKNIAKPTSNSKNMIMKM